MRLIAQRRIAIPGGIGTGTASDFISPDSNNSLSLVGNKLFFQEAICSISYAEGVLTFTDEEDTDTDIDLAEFIGDVFVSGATLVGDELRLLDNDNSTADVVVNLAKYNQGIDEVFVTGSTLTDDRTLNTDNFSFEINSGRNTFSFFPSVNRIILAGLGIANGAVFTLDETGVNFLLAGTGEFKLGGNPAPNNTVLGRDENGDFGWISRAATSPQYVSPDGTFWDLKVGDDGIPYAEEVDSGGGGGGGGEPTTNRAAVFTADAAKYGSISWAPSSTNFAIKARFKLSGSGDRVITGGDAYANFFMQVKGTGEIQFWVDGAPLSSSGAALVNGTYATIEVVKTGDDVSFYKDDVLLNTVTTTNECPTSAFPVRIGTSVSITNPMNGSIDYVEFKDPDLNTNNAVISMNGDNFNNSYDGSTVPNGTNVGGVTFEDVL